MAPRLSGSGRFVVNNGASRPQMSWSTNSPVNRLHTSKVSQSCLLYVKALRPPIRVCVRGVHARKKQTPRTKNATARNPTTAGHTAGFLRLLHCVWRVEASGCLTCKGANIQCHSRSPPRTHKYIEPTHAKLSFTWKQTTPKRNFENRPSPFHQGEGRWHKCYFSERVMM